ncbi:MAG: phage tail protein [Thermoanaerobaculia bacterium]
MTTFTAPEFPGGSFEWRAVAHFRFCPDTQSSTGHFIVPTVACPTTPPVASSPANRAILPPSQPVHFAWSAVAGAERYEIWLSRNEAPLNFFQSVPGNSTSLDDVLPLGVFAWHVVALVPNCDRLESTRSFFSIGGTGTCPTAAPVLTSPANGAQNLTSPVDLSWQPAAGAISYRVFVSIDGHDEIMVENTPATTARIPLPSGSVAWRVEAQYPDCPPVSSSGQTFTIKQTGSCPPSGPTLKAPRNGASNLAPLVEFEWESVTGAVAYNVWAGTGGENPSIIATTESTEIHRVLSSGPVTWFVEALAPGCPALRSSSFSFSVADEGTCDVAAATLLGPANGATDVQSPVEMSWTGVTGATAYRIVIWVDGQGPFPIAETTALNATVALPSGTIDWSVEADLTGCPIVISQRARFTVARGTTCGTTPAALVSPAAGASLTSPVTFLWSDAAGSAGYTLWISVNGEPPSIIAASRETTVKRHVPPGQITWFVEALSGGCPPLRSSSGTFTVTRSTSCPTAGPTLQDPIAGATSVFSPVEFEWSPVDGAVEYRVWIQDGAMEPVVIGVTSSETEITRPLPVSTFAWWVEAMVPGCGAVSSERAQFTIARATSCGTDAPQLLSPADDAQLTSTSVKFIWSSIENAAGYELWVEPEGGIDTPIFFTRTDTQFETQVPPGETEWWVVAMVSGCPPVKSEEFEFEATPSAGCDRGRPVIVSPPHGARSLESPVNLSWTPVPDATGYEIVASLNSGERQVIGTTATNSLLANLPSGNVEWLVVALFKDCAATRSAPATFSTGAGGGGCTPPERPVAETVGQAMSAIPYPVRWTPLAGVDAYEVQESADESFENPETATVNQPFAEYTHTVTAPTLYFYRVRGISNCSDDKGAFSPAARIIVLPTSVPPSTNVNRSLPFGEFSQLTQKIFIPGSAAGVRTIVPDRAWLTVTPSTITVPPEGTTVEITADPKALAIGTNTATLQFTPAASGKLAGTGSTSSSIPVSVSLVTPVAPVPKSVPPPNALIVPAVAHAAGVNSQWQSDVRVTNTSAQVIRYQLAFTASRTDGTQSGKTTTIELGPGQTMALDDILNSWFGLGTSAGESATGMLEIRPLNYTDSSGGNALATVASSRTFNSTATGTFGQFIPAVPFSNFVGKSSSGVLSLQQIAQSTAYRTNLGLVEGAGEPATVLVRVFGVSGTEITSFSETLLPGEHRQLDSFLAAKGLTLDDGRVELTVTSDTGKITACASTVDRRTGDPLLVSPAVPAEVSGSRYVLPGVADLFTGTANWRSDVRVYNAGTASTPATLTFYKQGDPATTSAVDINVAAGEVKVLDGILANTFGATSVGGVLHVTTPAATQLIVTGRTYDQRADGTYGQFIPAVTDAAALALGGRPLQLLQLEESDRFRTNLGLAEVSGNAVTVELSAVIPGSTVAPKLQWPLQAFEFVQLNSVLKMMGLGTTYNGRISIAVLSGTGKVTAYASMIDNATQDPTYIPAQ